MINAGKGDTVTTLPGRILSSSTFSESSAAADVAVLMRDVGFGSSQ